MAYDSVPGSNKEDVRAMNDYMVSRSEPKSGGDEKTYEIQVTNHKRMLADWKSFYSTVMSSWYVSDSDLASAKAKRNAMMKNQNAKAFEFVQSTAADRPTTPGIRLGTTVLEKPKGKKKATAKGPVASGLTPDPISTTPTPAASAASAATPVDKSRIGKILAGAAAGGAAGFLTGNPLVAAGGAIAGAFLGDKVAKSGAV